MNKASTLALDKVKEYFPYHRICLVKTLTFLVNCILQANSCNLNKAKKKGSVVKGERVEVQTVYTRFIRFFKMKSIEGFVIGIMQMVVHILLSYTGSQGCYCLAIDRTNWQLGRMNINILFIGFVLSNGCFIPLYFKLLDKKGNSSQAERIDLFEDLDWFFDMFQDHPIVVLGDREFIGLNWFSYLAKRTFDLVMRVRKKDYLEKMAKQLGWSVKKLEKKIARDVKRRGYFMIPMKIEGREFYYHVRLKRKEDKSLKDKDKYIRFISTSADHKWVIEQYDRRWKIEVFFEDCKTKGLDLEAINFTQVGKIRLMVAICSLCYVLCLIEGMIEYEIRQPVFKKDKASGKTYYRTSIFTKGYETIEQIVVNLNAFINHLNEKITQHYTVNQVVIAENLYAF